MERIADVLRAGFPLVAVLQLIRVYAQSIRKIAEAEVRLFHLYVHEPLIRQGVDALQMAEEMEGLARDLLPLTSPLMEYIHQRYLRFYIEQDVVGHMEAELGGQRQLGRVQMAFCFVDLTGFTRYTEEEGDEEAFDLVERFVETVEATLPAEATIVKTIGDEVMIVSPDPVTLTEWAVGLPGAVPGTPPAAGRRALRARGLSRRRLLRHRGQPDPPRGRPGPRRRGDGDHRGRRCDRQLGLPRVRPDRRGRAEGLSPAGGAVRRARPRGVRRRDARTRIASDAEDPRARVVRSPAWGPWATDDALGALAEVVRRSGLIDPISSGVVLVSGGADSACAAAGLAQAIGPASVHALHVNYGLRESADRDERVCRDLCSRLRIDLHIERPKRALAGNLQAAAREARYAAAEQLRARTGGDWIATGHTRTDLAETVLYRLAVSPGSASAPRPAGAQRSRRAAAAGAGARRDAPPRSRGRPAVRRRRDRTSTSTSRATGCAPRCCRCCTS